MQQTTKTHLTHISCIGAKFACKECWVEGTKLVGQRQFTYLKDDACAGRTTAQMADLGKAATLSGEPQSGIKGVCPLLSVMDNLPFQAAIDLAHTLYNVFKNIMSLFKNNTKLAAYKEPRYKESIRTFYKDNLDAVPQADKDALKKRMDKWKINNAAQGVRKDRLTKLKRTQKTQDLMDTMYRWAAGPGEFGNPSRRPLQWTGTMNIHNCQSWWVSDTCLYITYPFVPEEMYRVIQGLHEVFKRLLKIPVSREELKTYYPEVQKTMKKYKKVIPENFHGILVHALDHIYIFTMITGAPAIVFTMYIFERLLAMFNRMIHDRRHPEINLVNGIDNNLALQNMKNSKNSPLISSQQLSQLPVPIKKQLGIDQDEKCGDADDIPEAGAQLAKRLQNTTDVQLNTLDNCTGRNLFNNCTHESVKQVNTAVRINGQARRTVQLEPDVGNLQEFTRRSSGFEMATDQNVAGQLLKVFVDPEGQCILYVKVYPIVLHDDSGLMRVDVNSAQTQYVKPTAIGNVVVLAPWFDRGDTVFKQKYYCALKTK